MIRRRRSRERATTAASVVLALLVALLPPFGYFILSYQYLAGSLDSQAEVSARTVAQLISSNIRTWRFEELRLSELLQRRPLTPAPQVRRIVDLDGRLVAHYGDPVAWPWVTRGCPIYDAGTHVARIEVVQSLRPLVDNGLLVGVVSLALGFIIYIALGVYPRRVAEKALASLEESERRYRLLYRSMNEGMALFRLSGPDEDGFSLTFLTANPAVEAMLGMGDAQFAGMDVAGFLRSILGEHLAEIALGAESGEAVTFEASPPGWSRVYSVSVFYPEPGLCAALIQDLTEVRRAIEEREVLERKMLQAQKAESLGRMAGAISHHFNNLLGVVMGNLELAMLDLPQGSQPRASVAEAMAASGRAADISRLMLAYLGQSIGARVAIELSEICRGALPLLTESLPENVHLKIELPDERPIIRADATQIRQILTNLVVNAREALGAQEGEVTVAVHVTPAADIQAPWLYPPEWEPKDESYACLSVSDTGAGMNQETLEKVFDPFFSTKFTGRGLGLPIVLGVVKAHEGAVTVESTPGRGTVFRVFLPLSAEELPLHRKAEPADTVPPRDRPLVMSVDDEPMFRRMAKIMLERLGYDVLTAADGVEALEVFREHQDRVQCVLLDLTMPRMNGWETLAALRALRPGLPVILASGYDEAKVMQGYHPERPQVFLPKPYQIEDLEAAFGAAMGAPSARSVNRDQALQQEIQAG